MFIDLAQFAYTLTILLWGSATFTSLFAIRLALSVPKTPKTQKLRVLMISMHTAIALIATILIIWFIW